MNAEAPVSAPVSGVQPPPSPRSLADTGLSTIMMRDIFLKTMFRTNQDQVSILSRAISLPAAPRRARMALLCPPRPKVPST